MIKRHSEPLIMFLDYFLQGKVNSKETNHKRYAGFLIKGFLFFIKFMGIKI